MQIFFFFFFTELRNLNFINILIILLKSELTLGEYRILGDEWNCHSVG